MGNGILANLAALYFRKILPDEVHIVVVGPVDRGGLPVVGESTIEITARFLEEQLGLGQYLKDTHYPKYALTYYFKLDSNNPDDRTYSVHCNERDCDDQPPLPGWEGPMARPPSWQLNREVFDRDIREFVSATPGIDRILGIVKDVRLDGKAGHILEIEETSGDTRSLNTDWLVDVTGRRRLLARKLGITVKPKTGQRNCFWFHLKDFDRDLLKAINALGPQPPNVGEDYHYDRYFSTHHFMGRANWIWLIPQRAADDTELMSIGITSRPDLYQHDVRSIDQFVEHVSAEHPVISDLVESGTVTDTNFLGNYRYVTEYAYAPDKWCLLGDAAHAFDPLFSNGLAFSTIQLEQIGEMITRDLAGTLTPELVGQMDKALWGPVLASQDAITEWYVSMHDPFLSSLRLNWIEIAYFYLLLPMVVNRCHCDPDRMGLWRILQNASPPFEISPRLLKASQAFDTFSEDHFIYRGKEKVNPRALEKVDDLGEIRDQIVQGSQLRRRYTADTLAQLESALAEANLEQA